MYSPICIQVTVNKFRAAKIQTGLSNMSRWGLKKTPGNNFNTFW